MPTTDRHTTVTSKLTLLNDANMAPDKYDDFVFAGEDGQSSETDQLTRLKEIANNDYNYYRLVGPAVIERIVVQRCMLRFTHYQM